MKIVRTGTQQQCDAGGAVGAVAALTGLAKCPAATTARYQLPGRLINVRLAATMYLLLYRAASDHWRSAAAAATSTQVAPVCTRA